MFINSIIQTWENPEQYASKLGSTRIKFFIKGEHFHGKDIFECHIQYQQPYKNSSITIPLHFQLDNELFGSINNEEPDCVRYINMKIHQNLGGPIAYDKLEKLSKIKFDVNEIDMYIDSEKYNL